MTTLFSRRNLFLTFLSLLVSLSHVCGFSPTNKYLVPGSAPGPGCYDVFNFSYGRQVASTFVLLANKVGEGTPFPDGTVIMSFAQITIISNFYSGDLGNFNVSLYNSDTAGTVPTTEISKAYLLGNEGCNNIANYLSNNKVCLITVYFPVPYPRISPIRGNPDRNQNYWIVVSFQGQYNPSQTQEYQWPLLCMVDTGEPYSIRDPVVPNNLLGYVYRNDGSSSWLPIRPDYLSGGMYLSLFGPEPSPSATRSSTATGSATAAATLSASSSARASTSAVGSSSATLSATATSTTTSTPTNSINITTTLASAAAPDNTTIIAGSISGVLFGLVCGVSFFFLARQYRNGEGLFKNKARYGPKQEKDRSLSAKVENQILKLRGVAQPPETRAAKIPNELDPKSLSSIADAYDMVYGDSSSAPVMPPPGAVLEQSSSNSQADALAGALSRSGAETSEWGTSGGQLNNNASGRGRVMREKLGFGPQQASMMALKVEGNNNSGTESSVEDSSTSNREPSI